MLSWDFFQILKRKIRNVWRTTHRASNRDYHQLSGANSGMAQGARSKAMQWQRIGCDEQRRVMPEFARPVREARKQIITVSLLFGLSALLDKPPCRSLFLFVF